MIYPSVYSLEGRVLSESTGHNIYDLANDFKPEEVCESRTELDCFKAFEKNLKK